MLRRIEDDLLAFRNNTGKFTRATAKLRKTQLQPVSWWEKYGNGVPTLNRLAIRVLSQNCSSGSCERNWSTWTLYHTKRRNKLTTAQLERLVYCNCNLKLLKRAAMGPEPMQVNVDKIDIEKVRDIPTIPQKKSEIFTLCFMRRPQHQLTTHEELAAEEGGRLLLVLVPLLETSLLLAVRRTTRVMRTLKRIQTPRMPVIGGDEPEIFWRLDLLFFSCSIRFRLYLLAVCQYVVWIMDIRIPACCRPVIL
ncbi:hypothetical protein L7F22_037556 [Adiantum nelumboides]|nr:hypothetical protein [Adiantum nelumboides]MCO5583643.1 hypothetical protein [Adiantum nelumboides]